MNLHASQARELNSSRCRTVDLWHYRAILWVGRFIWHKITGSDLPIFLDCPNSNNNSNKCDQSSELWQYTLCFAMWHTKLKRKSKIL